MTARKHTPAHDYWHPRVEGQIRDAMQAHPGWFKHTNERIVISLAKRIVGEIVAGARLAPIPDDASSGVNGDGYLPVADRSGCEPFLHPDRKTEL